MDLLQRTSINQSVQTVHQLFESKINEAKNSIALIFKENRLTYNELNQQANRLAHYLIAAGLKKNRLVGVYFDRSPEMIISMLAILKAGCGYVPLDTSYPEERLDFMISDAQLSMIITSSNQEQNLFGKAVIITIEFSLDMHPALAHKNPENQVDEHSLIYVNYTSGSTGKPKGVAISHRSVLHLLDNPKFADLNSNTVILQVAPAAFDAFTFELWGALLNGGTCVLHDEKFPTINGLHNTIEKNKVTTAFFTTALFNLIIDENSSLLYSLHQVLIGGEAHSIKHFRKAYDALPKTELIHVYGPTECTTFTTYFKLTREALTADSIPIGYPINKALVYVLDEQRRQVELGCIGELYIGGPGLAREYLNDPGLTQNQFISDLSWLDLKRRIYKTGDLVSMLPDGALLYIGRKDYQIKIHGYRIELEEIEIILTNHQQINQAGVIVTENKQGNKKLIAYLVTNGEVLQHKTLQSYLRSRLPNYMIPSQYVWLKQIPLTTNGKIDRKALQNL